MTSHRKNCELNGKMKFGELEFSYDDLFSEKVSRAAVDTATHLNC